MKRLLNLASMLTRPKPAVGTTPADVVHRENKWKLLHYRRPQGETGGPRHKTPVLLVPSLINRHYVMDLLPGKSMAQDLVAAGHDVYCIDWGTPGDEDRYLSFDDVCDRYLGRAIRKVAKTSPREQAHVLGYCLGGTLATIHAAAHQEHVASLLLLAAPIDFSDKGMLATWTQSPTFKVKDIVDGFGNVPWQLMQSAFNMLRPTLGLAKAVGVIDRADNEEFLDGFLAVETWGNDNVSFPGECYRQYIEELYVKNSLVRGEFALSGELVRLENIHCPTTAIVFQHDNIVPLESAAPLMDRISSKDKSLVKLAGGHVGAVVSKSAKKNLWPAMSAFWAQRDARPVSITVPASVMPIVHAPAVVPSVGKANDATANDVHLNGTNGTNGASKTNGVHANGASKTNGAHANGAHVVGAVVTAVAAPTPERATSGAENGATRRGKQDAEFVAAAPPAPASAPRTKKSAKARARAAKPKAKVATR